MTISIYVLTEAERRAALAAVELVTGQLPETLPAVRSLREKLSKGGAVSITRWLPWRCWHGHWNSPRVFDCRVCGGIRPTQWSLRKLGRDYLYHRRRGHSRSLAWWIARTER